MADDLSLDEQIERACAGFEIDWDHPRRVAEHCDRLFDGLRHLHGLTKTFRPILHATGLLHDITLARGKEDHHETGAEAVLGLDVPALSASEKRIIAAAIRFHPRKVRVESFIDALAGSEDRSELQIAGRITALLRIADGLDHCRSQTTEIAGFADDGDSVRVLTMGGDAAVEDTEFTNEKTDFWNTLALQPIRIEASPNGDVVGVRLVEPGIPVAEAVRRIFQQQIEQLISLQYGLPYDEDVEFVHEMRVATRRLRSALGILGKSLGEKRKHIRTELSWLADALGTVRDCDVILLFLGKYRKQADPEHVPFIEALIDAERGARGFNQRELVKTFASDRCVLFLNDFRRLAVTPVGSEDGIPKTGRRASRPVWKQARRDIARRFERVEKYSRNLARLSVGDQHRLRIDCKKLRYTAEFFNDIYKKGLRTVTGPASKMQDLLGEVHDVVVWSERIRKHIDRNEDLKPDAPAAQALFSHLEKRSEEDLKKAQKVWRRFTRPKRRKRIRKTINSPRKK
jgi:CHAD domain-containing protein